MVEAVARKYHINLNAAVSTIPQEMLNLILYGTQHETMEVIMEGRNDRKTQMQMNFEGVIPNLERRFRETNSEYIRAKISEFMSDRICSTCKGNRLRPEALAVTVLDQNIIGNHTLVNQSDPRIY